MNKFQAIGRLTRDPEVRYTSGNNPVCVSKFSLAVERKFKRDGDADADFFNCTVFGKLAEATEKFFRKGIKIGVCGRIQQDSYTDKDGNKRTSYNFIIEEFDFCERATTNKQGDDPKQDQFINIPSGIDDELPFA